MLFFFFLQDWRAQWTQPGKNMQDHSLYSVGCEGEVEVAQFWQQIQERTIKVIVPFVRLRMATASSWVTPSRLCPLTAMIWSPLFRRPSSEAAPCNYKVGLFTSQKKKKNAASQLHNRKRSKQECKLLCVYTHIALSAPRVLHSH